MSNLPKGLESWNFIANNRHLITKYLSWDLGRGQEALFWEDSWDGEPPIDSLGLPDDCKNLLTNLWGSKVLRLYDHQ